MKYLEFILFVTVCTLFINSCKEDTPMEPDYTSIAVNSMEANIGGEIFNSSTVTTARFELEFVKINASAVTSGISFVLTDSELGDYYIGGEDNVNYMEYSSVSSDQSSYDLRSYTSEQRIGATGVISIESVDEENKTVSGSFSGTLVRDTDSSQTIEIEIGLFNQVPY